MKNVSRRETDIDDETRAGRISALRHKITAPSFPQCKYRGRVGIGVMPEPPDVKTILLRTGAILEVKERCPRG